MAIDFVEEKAGADPFDFQEETKPDAGFDFQEEAAKPPDFDFERDVETPTLARFQAPVINPDAGKLPPTIATGGLISGGPQRRPTGPGELAGLGKQVWEGAKEIPETLFTPIAKISDVLGLDAQTVADARDVFEGSMTASAAAEAGENPVEIYNQIAGQPQRKPNAVEQVLAGTQKGVVESLDFFLSPVGIATLGMGSLPGAAQKVIAAAFVAQMSKSMPEQYQAFLESKYAGDTEGMAKALTGMGLTTAFITQELGADYLFGLKGNQSGVLARAQIKLPQEFFSP